MHEKGSSFDFSVVMAVYNVERYIREAVDSLIHQTIGFNRIQLILIDDGSTDQSGSICDEYKRRFPENVYVVHKLNGGVSSARNAGIPLILGKYISFMDPDDRLRKDAFKKGKYFFLRHPEADLVSLPIFFFGMETGSHLLNYKFEAGTRVVNVMDPASRDCIQLSLSSCFVRASAAINLHFDENLEYAEDAKECLRILIRNPNLGLLANTAYEYRKREGSALNTHAFKKGWYFPYLEHFSSWAMDAAEKCPKGMADFIQYTVMYDLQWKIKRNNIPDEVMSPEEKGQFCSLLFQLISRMDPESIQRQKYLDESQILFLLSLQSDSSSLSPFLAEYYFIWEFFKVNPSSHTFTLEGYYPTCPAIENEDIEPYLLINEIPYPCQKVNRRNEITYSLDTEIASKAGFIAEIPLPDRELMIVPALRYRDKFIDVKHFSFGQFFPISNAYKHQRFSNSGYTISADANGLTLSLMPGRFSRISNEGLLLHEIWQRNLLGGHKAVLGRICYHLMKGWKHRPLWIVSDRIMKADDNGEALFEYIMKNRPPRTRVVFAISQNSIDAERVRKIGPCIDAMSFRHKMLHLLCDINISSQGDEVTINPFAGHHDALRDLLVHQKFVFLQHGVIKDDLSGWLNRYNKNLSGFVTSATPEYDSIIQGEYGYPADQIWLTGLPRFDRLYHCEEKKITVMPTWRQYLMDHSDGRTGVWLPLREFRESKYYQFYNQLLNSASLLQGLEEKGYQLQFFPHPNIRLAGIDFDRDPRVAFLSNEVSYRDIYAQSSLIVTDFSSAVFDFAYLRKPVLYCQFDRDEFFSGNHTYTKGYFDYERDGFGEVTYDLDSTVACILDYASHDCALKIKYRNRIDQFFAYHDQDNCKRVMEKIMNL